MEVMEAVRSRRSIRSYEDRAVPREIMDEILEAARLAPSASNVQSWKFKVVTDRDITRALRKAASDQRFVEEAPVVIVACTDLEVYANRVARALELLRARAMGCNLSRLLCMMDPHSHEDEVRCIINAVINVSIAVEHMALVATSLGLATCWVRAFEPQRVAEILTLPPECPPLVMLTLGYARENPGPRPRKDMRDILLQ